MRHSNAIFQQFIDRNRERNKLIVQPRMGFSEKQRMRQGLSLVKSLNIPAVGTVTIDSFTRSGDFDSASSAVRNGKTLNGYPIVSYQQRENKQLIDGLRTDNFPVQVRHGSPLPVEIFKSTIAAGIDAIEGGPISYCLPYSRVPISQSIAAWKECSSLYAEAGNGNYHIESFGGCMMGQLCPPSMLIAITLLEALFFKYYGVKSVSVSLAQGTNSDQDLAAIKALGELCDQYLGKELDWHIVYYSFMGKFPNTYQGAKSLIEESAVIAKQGGASRLIVKTVKEAHQIPSVEDNLDALKWTHQVANIESHEIRKVNLALKEEIMQESITLIESVMNLSEDPGEAIQMAFDKGYLDVPFCLHQSNKRKSLCKIDLQGNIIWSKLGNMPIQKPRYMNDLQNKHLTSEELLNMLSYNQFKHDYAEHYAETMAV